MNKLREKIDNVIMRHNLLRNEDDESIDQLEQILDDFTCQFVVWLDKNKKELKNEIIIEELLNYFKENVYNK
jgi:hypothetical protein